MVVKISKIVELTGAELTGDELVEISGVAAIEDSKPGDISFLANPKYSKYLITTKASAVIIPKEIEDQPGKTVLRSSNPYMAFLKVVKLFNPEELLIEKGIHATVVIGKGTALGKDVSIGAQAVIGRKCSIGERSVIMPGVVLGDSVTLGKECFIHANVSLRERITIGNRVVIHNGAVIGSDGFGFAFDKGKYHKIPQVGTVVIEDDVEIGANTTIDRATLGKTVISRGTKLDNLIQIAHNCRIGENCVIASQAGISGSTAVGNRVRIGGQAGFAGHIKIGDDVEIGAQSGVTKSVSDGRYVVGFPAKDSGKEFRIHGALRRLPDLLKDFVKIRRRVERLEKNRGNDD